MAIEKLLEPRYKVIADYPNSLYKIGKIFKQEGKYLFYEGVNHANFLKPENYPHIFKRLEWWEERSLHEMPDYLKDDNGVYKCRNWHYQSREIPDLIVLEIYNFEPERSGSGWSEKYFLAIRYKNILPATKEEFHAYELKQLESLQE